VAALAEDVPDLRGVNGLIVFGIDSGSPADKARLRTGERAEIDLRESPLLYSTIFEVNGQPVRDISDVCDVLASKRSGDTLSVLADALSFPPSKSRAIAFEMEL
jgi:S1-C subfamily serine protease